MGWMLLMSMLLTAPPGYERLQDGLPGWAEKLPYTEFPGVPVPIRLAPQEVRRLGEQIGEPTIMPAVGSNPRRTGYVFGRSDRPFVGFAIWLAPDGTGSIRAWETEPTVPPMREIKQRWLVPGIVSWLTVVAR